MNELMTVSMGLASFLVTKRHVSEMGRMFHVKLIGL